MTAQAPPANPQRCTFCGTTEDVYAPLTSEGRRFPALCGRCQRHVDRHARGLLRRREQHDP